MQVDWTDRFWSKVSPEPTSGCWLWTAARDRKGYGRFGKVVDGVWRMRLASRHAHFLARSLVSSGIGATIRRASTPTIS